MDDREVLAGGVNEVVRIGATVRRPMGPWSPRVHGLLRHLAAQGFRGAPRVLEVTDDGFEVLAAYRWVPLTAPGNADGFGTTEEQAARLRVFGDRYGLDDAGRAGLVDAEYVLGERVVFESAGRGR